MRKYPLIIFFLIPLYLLAEETDSIRSIVVDDETGMRLRDAVIRFDDGEVKTTQWDGSFVAKRDYSKAIISHVGYLARTLYRNEIGDTIRLYANGVRLNEVVVIGTSPKPLITMPMVFLDHTTATLLGNEGKINGGVDLFGILSWGYKKLFGGKKKKSKLEKVKKKLEKY